MTNDVGHDLDGAAAKVADAVHRLRSARREVTRVVVGQDAVVDELLVALLGGGHVLVEGAPGLGKTLLVRTLGTVFGLSTARVQFTPDLMPADITGSQVLVHDDRGNVQTSFEPGPVFAQLVLADEINRATPKTQSALLEAMQERTVTVAGSAWTLPEPFFVLATQNPIEMEGTYVLPEAQVDRFFLKVLVGFPDEAVLDKILAITTDVQTVAPNVASSPEEVIELQQYTRAVPIHSHMRRAVARFAIATQPDRSEDHEVRRDVRYGVSPRGAQAWILAAKAHALLNGRHAVDTQDLGATLLPALRHRVQVSYEAETDGTHPEEILTGLFERIFGSPA